MASAWSSSLSTRKGNGRAQQFGMAAADELQQSQSPAPCAAIQDLPGLADEAMPAPGEEPPSGTELELEAAPEPSCPCPKELPDIVAPALDTGLSPGAESMTGARGGNKRAVKCSG
ncbi:uncharacterized protein C2orf27A-like [Saimiri boliviensis]|uniref:uncharacterized protein C2orf27A-like n=1 Tax=Saimiri boliviensis TaxID=27679 RepID=UPI003D771AC3